MKVLHAFVAGVAGAIAMSATMFLLRLMGVHISLEAILGSLFEHRTSLSPLVAGFILHVIVGAAVACLYALAFEVVGTSGALMGGGLGLAHGLMAGLFMSGIPAMNPVSNSASAPGAFLSHIHFGPALFLLVHFIYGLTVGLVYGPVHRSALTPRRAG